MVALRFLLIISTTSLLTGCLATLPGKKVDGEGRYMQALYGNSAISQMDFPSSNFCVAEFKATKWNSDADLKCGEISQAERLPYKGIAKYPPGSGLTLDLHFLTSEQCQAYKANLQQSGVPVECLGIR